MAINYAGSREKAEALASEIGGKAFQSDVRDADQVKSMVAAVVDAYGHIDGLVNNAVSGKQHIWAWPILEARRQGFPPRRDIAGARR